MLSESSPPPSQSKDRAFTPVALKAAKDRLHAQGLNAKSWAQANGHAPSLVYKILGGHKKCHFGEGHIIAIKLGLKAAPKTPVAHV